MTQFENYIESNSVFRSDATIDREHRHLTDPAHVVLEFNEFIYVLGEYRASKR